MLGLDDPQARALLNKFDKDRSGQIELDEFRQLAEDLRRFKAVQFDEVARVFHKYDRNRNHSTPRGGSTHPLDHSPAALAR